MKVPSAAVVAVSVSIGFFPAPEMVRVIVTFAPGSAACGRSHSNQAPQDETAASRHLTTTVTSDRC